MNPLPGGGLLDRAFAGLVRHGALEVVDAGGRRRRYGDGSGSPVRVRFADRAAEWAFLLDPELRLGELFMDDRLRLEQGSVYDFLDLLLREAHEARPGLPARLLDRARYALRFLQQRNDARRARRNVAHHYDIDERIYALFLDEDWQYSCAYFEPPGVGLEAAQLAKKRRIAAKLLLRPGQGVLDIGCGWGGLALYLAGPGGAGRVTGVSLSEPQVARAHARAAEAGLQDRVDFRLQDYREVAGPFDRIVSVGMFEHVGTVHYGAFFAACRRLLADDGVMLLHTIGNLDSPSATNPWLTRYVFPGGHIPSLSEIAPAVERAGLLLTDLEVWRLHYAETLREWRRRFLARREEAALLQGERFCRMWEFYLSMAETAFRHEDICVFQLQLGRRIDAVPLSRGYMAAAETALAAREAAPAQPSR